MRKKFFKRKKSGRINYEVIPHEIYQRVMRLTFILIVSMAVVIYVFYTLNNSIDNINENFPKSMKDDIQISYKVATRILHKHGDIRLAEIKDKNNQLEIQGLISIQEVDKEIKMSEYMNLQFNEVKMRFGKAMRLADIIAPVKGYFLNFQDEHQSSTYASFYGNYQWITSNLNLIEENIKNSMFFISLILMLIVSPAAFRLLRIEKCYPTALLQVVNENMYIKGEGFKGGIRLVNLLVALLGGLVAYWSINIASFLNSSYFIQDINLIDVFISEIAFLALSSCIGFSYIVILYIRLHETLSKNDFSEEARYLSDKKKGLLGNRNYFKVTRNFDASGKKMPIELEIFPRRKRIKKHKDL